MEKYLKEARRSLDRVKGMLMEADLPFSSDEVQCYIGYAQACSTYVLAQVIADLNGEEPLYPPKKGKWDEGE